MIPRSEFGVDWPHLIAQIVSFCIVAFLLQQFRLQTGRDDARRTPPAHR